MSRRLPAIVVLLLLHVSVTGLAALALIAGSVADWGYDASSEPLVAADVHFFGIVLVPTVPAALVEAWAVLRPGWPLPAVFALVVGFLSSLYHGALGSLPATFKLVGSGPVLRSEIRWAVVDTATIVALHLLIVLALCAAWAALTRPGRAPA